MGGRRIGSSGLQWISKLLSSAAGWEASTGFVTKEVLREHLPHPGEGTVILRCGPLPMNAAVGAALDDLGYPTEQQFQF